MSSTPHGEAELGGARGPVEGSFDLRARLRIAATIALVAGALFLAIAWPGPPPLPWLLAVWGVHTALDVLALVATYTSLSLRWLDRLTVAVVLGHVANAQFYMWLSPTNPVLAANGLTCLMMASSVFFSWSGRRMLVVSVVTCTAYAVTGGLTSAPEVRSDAVPIALVGLVVGAIIATTSAEVLTRLRLRLARRQEELTALSARLMSVQEEERRRLSRELHDEFGQSLTAVNAHLWLIDRQGPTDRAALHARTAEARHVIARTLTAMRELSQLLRPAVLDEFGLLPSLEEHLKAFGQHHQIATRLTTDGLPERLPAEMETALYRITQEALTNVARHARATAVQVALSVERDRVRLEIVDDGVGLPAANGAGRNRGTGLIGIRERAHALGGTLTLSSGKGVRIRVEVPLPRA